MSDDAHDPHGDVASGLAARWDAQNRQGETALRRPRKGGGDMTPCAKEIQLLRQRIETRIAAAVERMPRYYGTYINPSDFVEDALLYALDEVVTQEPILIAEAALLAEMEQLRRELSEARRMLQIKRDLFPPTSTPAPTLRERHIEGTWDRLDPRRIFVEGAKWWQFHANGSTMFSSERDQAEAEAERRLAQGDWVSPAPTLREPDAQEK